MNNTVRLIIALVLTGAIAALATPQLAAKLPDGYSTGIALALSAALHRLDAEKKDTDKKDDDAPAE